MSQETEIRKTVIAGIARAAFVTEWANRQEERGRTFSGKDLYQVAPRTDKHARDWAEGVVERIESLNRKSIVELLYAAAIADGRAGSVPEDYVFSFGSDIGHQVMGAGVSWFDDHEQFPLRLPYEEYYR